MMLKFAQYCLAYCVLLLTFSNWLFAQSKSDGISGTQIQVRELRFDALETGNPSNEPAVIFLHGFPETAYMWRETMAHIEAEGYYCLAPNQRGYSKDARPRKKQAYEIEKLAQDVIDIADAKGLEKFHLVGHDWGSAVGWVLVSKHPDRVISWTAMSVPHIKAFADAIQNDEDQAKKSAYIKAFQKRGLSEWILKRKNLKLMREQLWNTCSKDQLEEYMKVFKPKGALTAALNWYRANYKAMKKNAELIPAEKIATPTLLIWGKKDVAINQTSVNNTAQYMTGDYHLEMLDVGHWLTQEAGPEVQKLILEHIKKYDS